MTMEPGHGPGAVLKSLHSWIFPWECTALEEGTSHCIPNKPWRHQGTARHTAWKQWDQGLNSDLSDCTHLTLSSMRSLWKCDFFPEGCQMAQLAGISRKFTSEYFTKLTILRPWFSRPETISNAKANAPVFRLPATIASHFHEVCIFSVL